MTDFSDRVERIAISGIREVFEAAGGDAINLGLGQPDFPAPENAREAAIDAIESGKADGYTSNPGRRTASRGDRRETRPRQRDRRPTREPHRDRGRQRGAPPRHRGPRQH